jgi:sulfopyruvate decarboxylase subunit beta
MLGSMGLASSIGLGLSLNIKKKVWVLDGDGSILMNLGTLSTISNYAHENYTLIILDNSSYGSTGDQPTHTSMKTNLADLAKAAKITNVYDGGSEDLTKTLKKIKKIRGPTLLIVKISPGNADVGAIPLTPIEIKNRFMGGIKC